MDIKEDYPTLTYNKIGRHVSHLLKQKFMQQFTMVNDVKVGDVHFFLFHMVKEDLLQMKNG